MDDDFVGRLLFEAIGRPTREAAVRACLAGNDTQCFTTAQYRAAYDRIRKAEWEQTSGPGAYIGLEWSPGLAEMHLQTSGKVREVSPGVWVPVEPALGVTS